MTPEQIELVQRAWGRVTALNNTYVQEVYTELFRLSPDLINLFPDPAGMPVTKVSETLNTVITSLEQLMPWVSSSGISADGIDSSTCSHTSSAC